LLAIDDVEMVAGVICDETTAWPPEIADQVRAASQEIRRGCTGWEEAPSGIAAATCST
jgi:hypothetical protein